MHKTLFLRKMASPKGKSINLSLKAAGICLAGAFVLGAVVAGNIMSSPTGQEILKPLQNMIGNKRNHRSTNADEETDDDDKDDDDNDGDDGDGDDDGDDGDDNDDDDDDDGDNDNKSPAKRCRRACVVGNEEEVVQATKFVTNRTLVAKRFNGKLYRGMVVDYDKTSRFWKIKYEDGDSEQYNKSDLLEAIAMQAAETIFD